MREHEVAAPQTFLGSLHELPILRASVRRHRRAILAQDADPKAGESGGR